MVLADSDRLPLIPSYSGYLQESITFRIRDDRPLWCLVPETSAMLLIGNSYTKALQPQKARLFGLGCSRFARHYSGNHDCFIFLRLLRCFSSAGLLVRSYVFTTPYTDITQCGLSHSEIRGSQAASAYSRLIAGNHVLHRLLVPRHPPCALGNFIINL